MRRRVLTGTLLTVIAVLTVLVLVGVGQGKPPKALPISQTAIHREISAIRAAAPEVVAGERLFASDGCGACHTMAAGSYGGEIGPRLDVQSQGDSVKAVLQNITDPPDDDKGYEAGLMPDDFAKRFSHRELLALADFIHAAASAAAGPQKHSGSH